MSILGVSTKADRFNSNYCVNKVIIEVSDINSNVITQEYYNDRVL